MQVTHLAGSRRRSPTGGALAPAVPLLRCKTRGRVSLHWNYCFCSRAGQCEAGKGGGGGSESAGKISRCSISLGTVLRSRFGLVVSFPNSGLGTVLVRNS